MTTIQNPRGISLSAHAVANGWPAPAARVTTTPRRGDYAERAEGMTRRNERRAAIARKSAWLNG